MRVLIDTNILIDYISKRAPYFESASEVVTLCANEKIDGAMAAHSVINAIYIVRKEYSLEERRKILTNLCGILDIVGIDKEKLIDSLSNEEFTDIEDCLQMECAREYKAQYIITRNLSDFTNSPIPAVNADDFLELVKS